VSRFGDDLARVLDVEAAEQQRHLRLAHARRDIDEEPDQRDRERAHGEQPACAEIAQHVG